MLLSGSDHQVLYRVIARTGVVMTRSNRVGPAQIARSLVSRPGWAQMNLCLGPKAQNPSEPVAVERPDLGVKQSGWLLSVQDIQHLFGRDPGEIVPRLPRDPGGV